jgi:hypothetical protein
MNRTRSESRLTDGSTILFHDQSHCLALCSFVIGFSILIIGNPGRLVKPYCPAERYFWLRRRLYGVIIRNRPGG